MISKQPHPRILLALVVLLSHSACGPPPRGYPIYDASHGVLSLDQVAQISGQVIAIDGQAITKDIQRFEVLPGCHLLRMTGAVSYSSAPEYGGMQLYLGEHQFALNTEAAHRYIVELEHSGVESTAPSGRLDARWVVTDLDATSKEGRSVALYSRCP